MSFLDNSEQTFKKLQNMGLDENEAKTLIGKCLSIELLDVIKNGNTYNHERYVSNLKGLPMATESKYLKLFCRSSKLTIVIEK